MLGRFKDNGHLFSYNMCSNSNINDNLKINILILNDIFTFYKKIHESSYLCIVKVIQSFKKDIKICLQI